MALTVFSMMAYGTAIVWNTWDPSKDKRAQCLITAMVIFEAISYVTMRALQ